MPTIIRPDRQGEAAPIPSLWQRKIIWTAVSFLAVVTIGALSVFLIRLTAGVLSYLQPILVPIAIAGVLAFLLEPVVRKLCQWGVSRLRAVILVFFVVFAFSTSILVWIIPEVYGQGVKLAQKLPAYSLVVRQQIGDFVQRQGERLNLPNPFAESIEDGEGSVAGEDSEGVVQEESGTPDNRVVAQPDDSQPQANVSDSLAPFLAPVTSYLQEQAPILLQNTGKFLQRSVGGFLGVFGFLLGLILVPIYLFFFLNDGPKISRSWAEYLPLRASHFKDEVVATLTEINGYLINFFRGQLLVSLIDGGFTAIGLLIIGLDYALLIGLMVGIIGLIPYIGIILCWIPAVVIAAVQWPGEWFHPLLVTGIFIIVQQLDGLFIAPKIVGNSVGLHPMTVIVSLFAWTLMLGGLLGAILAVPLTATLKVLLKRYVWEKHQAATNRVLFEDPPPEPDEKS